MLFMIYKYRFSGYDTGGGNPSGANLAQSVVLPFLRSQGVRSVDSLVISHGDLDHSAGADEIGAAMPVAERWHGGVGVPPAGARRCRAGMAWRWDDDTRFQFLAPAGTGGLSSNNASCVLMIEANGRRVLLAGDIEASQERQLIRYWQRGLASDVLLVAHHGSRTSTTQSWLNRVGPQYAIINNAYGNRFGHPAAQVLQRLETPGTSVFHTARSGALEIVLQGEGPLPVAGERDGIKPWWL